MIRLIIDSEITIFSYAKQAMKYSELEKMLKKAGCYYIEPGRGAPAVVQPDHRDKIQDEQSPERGSETGYITQHHEGSRDQIIPAFSKYTTKKEHMKST